MPLPLAGSILTATDLSNMFPTNIDAWATYTPTWTQSATISKTVNRASYMKIGRAVLLNVMMTATSAGTANNVVGVTLPVNATGQGHGSFWFNDAGTAIYSGTVRPISATQVAFWIGGSSTGALGQTGGGFTSAIASGDVIEFTCVYEGTS